MKPALAYKTNRGGTQLGQIEARPFVWVTVEVLICMQAYGPPGSIELTLSHTLIYVLISPLCPLFLIPPPFSPPPPLFINHHISLLNTHTASINLLLMWFIFLFKSPHGFIHRFFFHHFFFLLIFNSLSSIPGSLYPHLSFFHINSQSDK